MFQSCPSSSSLNAQTEPTRILEMQSQVHTACAFAVDSTAPLFNIRVLPVIMDKKEQSVTGAQATSSPTLIPPLLSLSNECTRRVIAPHI